MTGLVYQRVHERLQQLRLLTLERVLDNTLDASNAGDKSFLDLLDELLDHEVAARRQSSFDARLRLSALPARKTLDEFDYGFQPGLDPKIVQELRTMRFVHNAENVLFLGPPGVGKTHLAIGLALEALKAGFQAYYTSLPSLLDRLKRAQRRDQLQATMRVMVNPKVLVLDEIGYQSVDRESATLFFDLITKRYENSSTIFTSNKSFGEWGEVFGDSVLATAILDRILHHCTVVNIRGDSYRLKNRRRTGTNVQIPQTPTPEVSAKG